MAQRDEYGHTFPTGEGMHRVLLQVDIGSCICLDTAQHELLCVGSALERNSHQRADSVVRTVAAHSERCDGLDVSHLDSAAREGGGTRRRPSQDVGHVGVRATRTASDRSARRRTIEAAEGRKYLAGSGGLDLTGKAAVLKTAAGRPACGFESHALRVASVN